MDPTALLRRHVCSALQLRAAFLPEVTSSVHQSMLIWRVLATSTRRDPIYAALHSVDSACWHFIGTERACGPRRASVHTGIACHLGDDKRTNKVNTVGKTTRELFCSQRNFSSSLRCLMADTSMLDPRCRGSHIERQQRRLHEGPGEATPHKFGGP